jgi:glutamate-1-semialdehyde aminotransferase
VGALLIFDEVITGFRLARGGAEEYFGVTPDLWCFGKVIGGGLPWAPSAARAQILAALAPSDPSTKRARCRATRSPPRPASRYSSTSPSTTTRFSQNA